MNKTVLSVALSLVTPFLFLILMTGVVFSVTASDDAQEKRETIIAEKTESFDSELVHARTTDRQYLESADSRVMFPIFWTNEQQNAAEIAVAAAEHELDYVGVIVASEAERLGANASAQECWLFEAEDLADADPENALPRGVLTLPEEGGFWTSDNWCQEHGLWNDNA